MFRILRIFQDENRRSSILSHPLTAVFFEFILTGIVAVSIATHINSGIEKRERKAAESQQLRESVQTMIRLIDTHFYRGELVVFALWRGTNIEELKWRKKNYDEAYSDWHSELRANLFLIKNIIPSEDDYKEFHDVFKERLDDGILEQFDRCITDAYDIRVLSDENPRFKLNKCIENEAGIASIWMIYDEYERCVQAVGDILLNLSKISTTKLEIETLKKSCPEEISVETHYDRFMRLGLEALERFSKDGEGGELQVAKINCMKALEIVPEDNRAMQCLNEVETELKK